jgi:hypothetical protein
LRQERDYPTSNWPKRPGCPFYVHDIETGKKFPKADKILALAKALGVDYDYLYR